MGATFGAPERHLVVGEEFEAPGDPPEIIASSSFEHGSNAQLLPAAQDGEDSRRTSRCRSRAVIISASLAFALLGIAALATIFAPAAGPRWWQMARGASFLEKFSWPWADLFLGRTKQPHGWVAREDPVTTAAPLPYPSLLCFLITRTSAGEGATHLEALAAQQEFQTVQMQYAKKVGIFACDKYVVFSDKAVVLNDEDDTESAPFKTTKLSVSLRSKEGKIEHILNAYIFMEAWHQVLADKTFLHYDYIVKVDPDAVFFPSRLRTHMRKEIPSPKAGNNSIYFINCKYGFGFYGALEVISRDAAEAYYLGYQKCTDKLPWKEYGEDLFMKECLDLLDVRAVRDMNLITDAYCGEPVGDCLSGKVAFHPLKNPEVYFHCQNKALGLEVPHHRTPPPPHHVAVQQTHHR